MEEEVIYDTQHYLVHFDFCNPVDVRVSIYHENQTKLTREEIIEEALGYLEEININSVKEKDCYEIETIELKKKK